MDVAITKMSSKGQVVIPLEMRKGLREGDKLLIIQDDDKLIMKKASKLSENLEEDLEFVLKKFGLTRDAFEQLIQAAPKSHFAYATNLQSKLLYTIWPHLKPLHRFLEPFIRKYKAGG